MNNEPRYYAIQTFGERQLSKAFQEILESKGYSWQSQTIPHYGGEQDYREKAEIVISTNLSNKTIWYGCHDANDQNYKTVSVQEFVDIFKLKTITVQLNSAYRAEVSKENVVIFTGKDKMVTLNLSVIKQLVDAKDQKRENPFGDIKKTYLTVRTYGSKEISAAVQTILFDNDYRWVTNGKKCNHFGEDTYKFNSGVSIYTESLRTGNSRIILQSSIEEKELKIISMEEFIKLFKSKTREVVLSADYTALVSGTEVKVGCQTFPLSIIDDLAAAVKEVSK